MFKMWQAAIVFGTLNEIAYLSYKAFINICNE